uniref:Uncharacterized protein n=1 Tax=Rhizophora mucronata TaxID=61149 RepID=A0A2P2NRT4_RHIMU
MAVNTYVPLEILIVHIYSLSCMCQESES